MAVQLHKASSCFYLAAPALSWGRFFRSDSPTCAFAVDSGKSRSKVFTYGLCCPHRLRLRSPSLAPGAPSVPQSAARAGCLGPSRKTPSSPEARCLAKNLRNARSSTSHGTKRRDMHFSNGPTCVIRRVVRLPSYCFPSSAARPFSHAARTRVRIVHFGTFSAKRFGGECISQVFCHNLRL